MRSRHVVFVDEFPMTSSGKVQKVKLRERARSANTNTVVLAPIPGCPTRLKPGKGK